MTNAKKILLVDDDEAFNFLNRIAIQDSHLNCSFVEALDGKAALQYLQQNEECPDVILLDVNMPVMDGFEFLEQFERQKKCNKVSKVYILTSSLRDEDRMKSLNNKYVKGYFDKPLNASHVKKIISDLNE